MFLKLLAVFALIGISLAAVSLYESSGFHCKTKLSMRLDRRLHGEPREAPPPFDVQVLDEEGHKTEYYEPGKIYTIRLIGYQYYRGLLLQPRLCDEHGFVIGSLRGGRFLETPDWIQYGIRLQECDMKYPLEDSVTHADDSRKFVTQIQWTAGRDVGNIQFMFTIVSENDVYWERWRPRSGFLQPIYSKQFPSEVLRQVFYNEKYALKFLAGKFTSSSQESKTSKEVMPKMEEALITIEKPEMPMEAKKVLEKMEKPEFWSHHDGEVKIHAKEKTDNLEMKQKKEGEAEFISDNKNSGEAKINEEMIEEITESDEERVEEKPFIGDNLMENDTITMIPEHESITHLPEITRTETKVASLDSGEATVQPSEPETLKDEKPLKPAVLEEAFSHDNIEIKEVEETIAPEKLITKAVEVEATTVTSVEESETTLNVVVKETTTENTIDATSVINEEEITTSASTISDTTPEIVTEKLTEETSVTEIQETETTVSPPKGEESETTTVQIEEKEKEKIEAEESITKIQDDTTPETTVTKDIENNDDETTLTTEQNAVEDILESDKVTSTEDNEKTTESSMNSEMTHAEEAQDNNDDEVTTEMVQDSEETTETSVTATPTAEEEMKDIENDLSHVSETPEATITESVQDKTTSNDSENEITTEAPLNNHAMTENSEAATENPKTESETQDRTMTDKVTEGNTEIPMEETTESIMNDETTDSIETTSEEPATSESNTIDEMKEEITKATEVAKDAETTTVSAMEEKTSETEDTNPSNPNDEAAATIEESTSTSGAETTTSESVSDTTEAITTSSTEEIITSTVVQVNLTSEATPSTPTFDELITTLSSHKETEASNNVDVESTSEIPMHPKDISRRRR